MCYSTRLRPKVVWIHRDCLMATGMSHLACHCGSKSQEHGSHLEHRCEKRGTLFSAAPTVVRSVGQTFLAFSVAKMLFLIMLRCTCIVGVHMCCALHRTASDIGVHLCLCGAGEHFHVYVTRSTCSSAVLVRIFTCIWLAPLVHPRCWCALLHIFKCL